MASDDFELIDELARAVSTQQWVLVGGFMVHAHAQLADLPNPRPTTDVDAILEIASTINYSAAAAKILELGFTHYESLDHRAPAYRFERGTDRIDLMAPDRGTSMRYASREVLRVPGSASALKNTETFTTAAATTVRIPNLAGALALKGAAIETVSPNPIRHAQDGVVLFACAQQRGMPEISNSQRAKINKLLRRLASIEAWSLADRSTRRQAVLAARSVRPDWSPPTMVLRRG